MKELEDLVGRQFGELKVLSLAPSRVFANGKKQRCWNCKCLLCGSQKEFTTAAIKDKRLKSCGCLRAIKGKAARNKKKCVICGNEFECPPSDKTVTCSIECRRIRASRASKGRKLTDETKAKMSAAQKGKYSFLPAIGTEAALKSPKSGRFETNKSAIDWHLVSPGGKHYRFHSLNCWLRDHCKEFFDCEPDSKEFRNVASGLRGAKRAVLGKVSPSQRPCCTYKDWQVIPTEDDLKKLQ